ncbi:MAG: sigma 54-interacting transcriptional regulator [Pseudomonadota bacterium]
MPIRSQPIGSSPSFMALMDRVSDYASTDRPVLIVGERGTGKELVASRVHFLSPRWEAINVRVNCAAFDGDALDRELFGQTFMDGRADTNGRFFEADGGTLFIDSIDQMPIRLQEKLMHTIEHGRIQATGEIYGEEVNVRVVAATSVDLPAAVAQGRFRADLLDRIAFHVITLPPLQSRPEDIPALVEHFGKGAVTDLGADAFPGLTAEAMEKLLDYDFPGNVRELKGLIERSTVKAFLADESLSEPISVLEIDPFDSPYRPERAFIPTAGMSAAAPTVIVQGTAPHEPTTQTPDMETGKDERSEGTETPDFSERVLAFERRLIDEAMRAENDHQGKAAERLGLTYHQLRGLLRKHGLKK